MPRTDEVWKVGELAARTGLTVRTLHHYDAVGLLSPSGRTESMHGYKMVKWVRSVSWIKDYAEVGDGMGGTREDSGYQDMDARI